MKKLRYASVSLVTAAIMTGTAAFGVAWASWEDDWNQTLAAAKKEGVSVVSGPPGASQRQAITSFWAKTFPDIRLEYTGARGTQMVAKVVRERASGLYNWDIIIASTDPTVFSLVPTNGLAPIRDALIKPDISQDETWIDSFDDGFMDKEKKYFFNAMGTGAQPFGYVNRKCVNKDVFNSLADMGRPKLKGKIVWYDPTRPSTGARGTWVLSLSQSVDWLKDLFQNHDVTFSRDYRQMADWLVSCTKFIAIGMPPDVLEQMQKQGIGDQVEELQGRSYLGDVEPGGAGGNESIGWYSNAPHPNAAKVFINWYLTQPFQEYYAHAVGDNSRRVDTTPGDPEHVMHKGVKYLNWSNENATLQIRALQEKIKQWGVLQ